jgi:hypothetical protein
MMRGWLAWSYVKVLALAQVGGLDPESIAAEINRGARYDFGPLLAKSEVKPWYPLRCGGEAGACAAEVVRVARPDQRIVVVSKPPFRYYFRFLKGSSGGGGRAWEFSGFHEVQTWNHPAWHALEHIGERSYFRISSHGIRGSDVDSEYVGVFDLSRRKEFEPAYSYHAEGRHDRHGFGVSRRVRSAITIDARGGGLRHSVNVALTALD